MSMLDMIKFVWYILEYSNLVLLSFNMIKSVSTDLNRVFTPEQVAALLQLNKNTIYELINRGEIIAKKLGKVYRIPASSISFVFTGLDWDLYNAQIEDAEPLDRIHAELSRVRKQIR
jgi:excisionase family DNA binding protein